MGTCGGSGGSGGCVSEQHFKRHGGGAEAEAEAEADGRGEGLTKVLTSWFCRNRARAGGRVDPWRGRSHSSFFERPLAGRRGEP